MFQQELGFFIKNQESLVDKYKGKILVLKGKRVMGAYDTPLEAFNEATKKYKPGSFMIQPCEPGPEAYTVTISSSGIVEY
jgi:hypothetical protein